MGRWSSIKHGKLAANSKKAIAFAEHSKEITVAARLAGPDPNFNFRLRNAIERGKAVGMPNENIQRAIDKTKEASGVGYEEILYEAYGPEGSALLIEAVTNNRNRTASEIRLILGKYDSKLGESGCVSWGFEKLGIIYCPKQNLKKENNTSLILDDELILNLVLESADQISPDIIEEVDEWVLACPVEGFEKFKQNLTQKIHCSFEYDYWSEAEVEIQDLEIQAKVSQLLESLEANEDIQKVYHNVSFQ